MLPTHRYTVNTQWLRERTGTVTPAQTSATILFDVPVEFGGEAGHWTPEHMLVAAVASCYVATFSAIAAMSRLEFLNLEVAVEGVLTKEADGLRFTHVIVRPVLTLPEGADEGRAQRLLEKAEGSCLIARSLSAVVSLESQIHYRELLPA